MTEAPETLSSTIAAGNETEVLGDIYCNEAASSAYKAKKLASFENESGDNDLRVIFKNQTPETLTLCWSNSDCKLRHFYKLRPSKTVVTSLHDGFQTRETGAHVESTQLGHCFVLGTRLDKNDQSLEDEDESVDLHSDEDDESADEEDSSSSEDDDACDESLGKIGESREENDNANSPKGNASVTLLNPIDIIAAYRPTQMTLGSKTGIDDEEDSDEEEEDLCVHIVTISRQLKTHSIHDGEEKKDENKSKWDYHLSVCHAVIGGEPLDTSSRKYVDIILGGWPVKCDERLIENFSKRNEDPTSRMSRTWDRIEKDIIAASIKFPPKARELLRECTPIWINKNQYYGPKCAPVEGSGMCFHPEKEWLTDNGMSANKCGGVELYDAKYYLDDVDLWHGVGGIIIHELSHAWHCKFVKDGFDNSEVLKCYEKAMAEKLYDCVKVHTEEGHTTRRAYACTDECEYFAELSVAFLGGVGNDEDLEFNKWFPFNRNQLKEHDPRAFELLDKLWNIE